MKETSYMPISEFSRMTGIKRANLIFYDQIGLLIPERRGENGYRFYSRRQLGSAYLIVTLRELNVGLEDIKRYAEGRTPDRMLSFMDIQKKRIAAEIARLNAMRDTLDIYTEMAKEALEYEREGFRLEQKEREAIFLGEPVRPDLSSEAALDTFYDHAASRGVSWGNPLGVIVSRRHFEEQTDIPADRFYFKVKRGGNGYKPAGLYASAYGRCRMGEAERVYARLLSCIREQGLSILGDVWEEYPLNEMSIVDDEQYCVRLEVLVERTV